MKVKICGIARQFRFALLDQGFCGQGLGSENGRSTEALALIRLFHTP
jgi:hypothetical protein